MESIVNQGKLVPDDVIVNILSRRLEKSALKGESGFILDGFPRTTRQAVRISNLLFWGNDSDCGFSILSCALYCGCQLLYMSNGAVMTTLYVLSNPI